MIYYFSLNELTTYWHIENRDTDNCSVPDTINTLGGGPAVLETLTTDVGNWGGLTTYPCKALTTIEGNWGGVTSNPCKALTHMVAKWGGVQFSSSNTLTHIVVKCGGGWSRELKTVTHDGVWYGSVAPPLP